MTGPSMHAAGITRRRFLATLAGATAAAASHGVPGLSAGGLPHALAAAAPRRGGTLRIAEVGEPLTLDVIVQPASLTANMTLGVFEELFAFDANWRVQPSLVSGYEVSKDGLTYAFTLRRNVPFHNGKTMGPDDVIASLYRWGRVNSYGTFVYKSVESATASGSDTVVLKLKTPFAPLLSLMPPPAGAAAIMPKELVDGAGAKSPSKVSNCLS